MNDRSVTTKPRIGERLQLKIDRLAVGGRGVGRSGALVIFVPDVAPNETVEVEITLVKKNYAEARLVAVVTASPSRMEPPCPVAGVCGGCNWQHIAYHEQLLQKRELVRESLRKFSGFDVSSDALVQPVIASPRPLRYRNRIQLHHSGKEIGYFRRGSHALVAIEDCPIAESPIAAEIPRLRAELSNQPAGRIEVFVTEDEQVLTRKPDLYESDEQDDLEGGMGFAFSQVNTQQNRNLVSLVISTFVMKFLDVTSPAIFDLYAGSGNFTFPLAKSFPKATITAVELNRDSVSRGEAKSSQTGQSIRWAQSDVGSFLKSNPIPENSGVLIDPPRTGCTPDVVEALANSRLQFLVYVSCHPVTLSRDLKAFSNAGFTLESVQPFDMFPQTDHVETLVILTR